MPLKTFDIDVDLILDPSLFGQKEFEISQGDLNTVQLNIHIFNDGIAMNITDYAIRLAIKKPSGLRVYQDCTIIDATQGIVQVILASQSHIEDGMHLAEVEVIPSETEAAITRSFYYIVKENIINDEALESESEFGAIQKLLDPYDKKPILIDGFPTITPEYIGQMSFDRINQIAYIARGLTNLDWQTIGTGTGDGGGDGSADLTNYYTKAETNLYFAAADHDHVIADVTGLQAALDSKADDLDLAAKADLGHNHVIADVTGLQAALDTKADQADVYTKAETYNKTEVDTMMDGITTGGGTIVTDNLTSTSTTQALSANQGRILNETKAAATHTHDYADITGKPTTFTPADHDHVILDVTGLQAALDSKAAAAHSHDYASITNKPTTFTPAAHNHAILDVTGLQAALDAKATSTHTHDYASITGKPATFAPSAHTHAYVDITGKPTTFAPSAHTHVIADVTNLQTTLDAKAAATHTHDYASITGKPTTFTPSAHTHAILDVTGLQAALDSKAAAAHSHAYADITDKPTTFTPSAHTHDYASITGKPTTFAPEAHSHDYAEITGKPATFAPSAHSHVIADVTDLQTSLDAKAEASQMNGLSLWNGSQADYDLITTKDPNTLYFIT